MMFIDSWAAMTIGDPDKETKNFGACAKMDVVPAALRRRLGDFGRVAARCGLGVAPQGTSADLVFCSRHGDSRLTYDLLMSCLSGELISPMKFSLSVHNAIAGIIDLARQDYTGHTAIAAGRESFSAGLIEAAMRLAEQPDMPVVMLYIDLPLPPAYLAIHADDGGGIALALRLVSRSSAAALARIDRAGPEDGDLAGAECRDSGEVAHAFLSALKSGHRPGSNFGWRAQGNVWMLGAA